MHQDSQFPVEPWRVLAIRAHGSEFLAIEKEGRMSLPCIDIPKGTRVAQELNGRLRAIWNLDAFSLCPIRTETIAREELSHRAHIMEAVRDDDPTPPGACWLKTTSANADLLAPEDLRAVHAWRDELLHIPTVRTHSPLGRPACLVALRAWVQQAIDPSGWRLGTEFLQLNAERSFSLVRFETNGRAVWFKAVGEPNTREFELTVALSRLFPRFLPELLATEPDWNAWLSAEAPGRRLAERDEIEAWRTAARDLAALQIASVPLTKQLLRTGARDVRSRSLRGSIIPFFEMLRELMARQSSLRPPQLSPHQLIDVEGYVRQALDELQIDGVPDSLGHLDLNPGNIIVSSEGAVFLDWAEACVGHPFFTFAYLLEHFRRTFKADDQPSMQLIEDYAKVWKSHGYEHPLEACLSRALFLAVFVHAVSTEPWRCPNDFQAPQAASYYRSLARRMHAYSSRIQAGASQPAELWR